MAFGLLNNCGQTGRIAVGVIAQGMNTAAAEMGSSLAETFFSKIIAMVIGKAYVGYAISAECRNPLGICPEGEFLKDIVGVLLGVNGVRTSTHATVRLLPLSLVHFTKSCAGVSLDFVGFEVIAWPQSGENSMPHRGSIRWVLLLSVLYDRLPFLDSRGLCVCAFLVPGLAASLRLGRGAVVLGRLTSFT